MATEEVIAKRYALGLAEQAKDEGKLRDARRDLRALADLLDPVAGGAHVPEFAAFLAAPGIPSGEKQALAAKVVAQTGIGQTVGDFLGVLIRHDRVALLPRVARLFADIAGALSGELIALVHTARPLSEDQDRRLSEALSSAFSVKVRIHQRIEPGLLAGARITVGDKTLDGTVLGRLESLKHTLVAGTLAEGALGIGKDPDEFDAEEVTEKGG